MQRSKKVRRVIYVNQFELQYRRPTGEWISGDWFKVRPKQDQDLVRDQAERELEYCKTQIPVPLRMVAIYDRYFNCHV
jgi:hypothetical protein